jgi:hypothetical protein
MKTALFLSLILSAAPALAGGPVIIEEDTPVVSAMTEDGRIPPWLIPVGVGLIALAILAGGGSACNGEPETPPSPSGC